MYSRPKEIDADVFQVQKNFPLLFIGQVNTDSVANMTNKCSGEVQKDDANR